jgi:uncharacterized protein (TIGR02246 family)
MALEERVLAAEDQVAIRDVFTHYGFAVDSADVDATAALFSKDSVKTVDGGRFELHGRDDIRRMVFGDGHQSIVSGSSHAIGPVHVTVDGDEAVAIGYSHVDYSDEHGVRPIRRSANWWRLLRTETGWTIVERRTQLLGTADGQAILYEGL